MVNLPSLSEVVTFSLALQVQLSSSSIQTSAPEIYPSTTTPSVSLYPSTVTESDLDPPAPEQVIEKPLLPAVVIVTDSEPEVPVWLVQDAEQEVALVDDQVRVEVLSRRTEVGSADKFTVGAGVVGVLPPPPPPPQEDNINKEINIYNFLYIYINLKQNF